jgi:hypothetical protein
MTSKQAKTQYTNAFSLMRQYESGKISDFVFETILPHFNHDILMSAYESFRQTENFVVGGKVPVALLVFAIFGGE